MFKNKKINYLISGLNKKSGRNSRGKITVYHKGGGNKINYRIIDFKRYNKQGKVVAIQYDPNRSSFIALLYNQFENKYFYILAPDNLHINDIIYKPVSKDDINKIIYKYINEEKDVRIWYQD